MLDREELRNIQKNMHLIPETVGDLQPKKKKYTQTYQSIKIEQAIYESKKSKNDTRQNTK